MLSRASGETRADDRFCRTETKVHATGTSSAGTRHGQQGGAVDHAGNAPGRRHGHHRDHRHDHDYAAVIPMSHASPGIALSRTIHIIRRAADHCRTRIARLHH
jgi:hypothetical protein